MKFLYSWLIKQEVSLHFKSGRTIRCFAKTLKTTTQTGTGDLLKVNVEGQRGFPHYAVVGEIEAITTREVPIWKGLPYA